MHITLDVFRITQMIPVPACSHAGKKSSKEVNLRFMIMLLLKTSEAGMQCDPISCLNALEENTVGHSA